ncbi:MAG: hypothetical protein ACYTG0_40430, partial [Planctomycetota bacterium]
ADCAEQGARYVVVAGPEAATGVPALEAYRELPSGDGFRIYRLAPEEPADGRDVARPNADARG